MWCDRLVQFRWSTFSYTLKKEYIPVKSLHLHNTLQGLKPRKP